MSRDFFRFPHTPHLAWLGPGKPREDKVMSPDEALAFLDGEIVVEEKIDGANLGISLDEGGQLRVQNRGAWLVPPYGGQFSRLQAWLDTHQERLFDALDTHLIAFGEWCAVRHSLDYDRLPDWWIVFDVYDRRAQRFLSTARRDAWAQQAGLSVISPIARGRFSLDELRALLETKTSHYRFGVLEGFILRREDDTWLHTRAKLVRAQFVQAIASHWRRRSLQWNRLDAAREIDRIASSGEKGTA